MLHQYFWMPSWIFITGTTVLQHVGLLVQADITGDVTIYTLLLCYPISNMIFQLSRLYFYGTDWAGLCSAPGAGESVRWGKRFLMCLINRIPFISIQKSLFIQHLIDFSWMLKIYICKLFWSCSLSTYLSLKLFLKKERPPRQAV